MTALAELVKCGTVEGWAEHFEFGSTVCDACRAAYRRDLDGLEPDLSLVVEDLEEEPMPEVEDPDGDEDPPEELTDADRAGIWAAVNLAGFSDPGDELDEKPKSVVLFCESVGESKPEVVEKPKRVRKPRARKAQLDYSDAPDGWPGGRAGSRRDSRPVEPVPDDGMPVPWAERKTCEMAGCAVEFWDTSKAHKSRFCTPAHKFEATRRLNSRAQTIAWEPAFSRAALRTAEGYATYDVFASPGELRFVLRRRGVTIVEAESWLAGGGGAEEG